MTIILALLGIGIFAIPAALLSSAFSDQLRIERETLKSELFQMMADGVIDEAEKITIHREAKRLHIPHDEVERMIQRARQEHELKEDVSVLPLHKIAANPEHALEFYRETLARLRQLGLLTQAHEFEALARTRGRLSDHEWQIWQSINHR